MEIKIVKKKFKELEVKISFSPYNTSSKRQELTVGDVTIYIKLEGSEDQFQLFIMLLDRVVAKDTINACRISSQKLQMNRQKFICDGSEWRLLHEKIHDGFDPFDFDLTVASENILLRNPFEVLYNDDSMADFELSAEDGSVKFHSVVLACASLTLQRMLSGNWSETESRTLQVRDTTKATLRHLKEYLYLYKLPEDGLRELLLLASFYMMPELQNKCIESLLYEVTTENCAEVAAFALNNNLKKLFNGILELARDGVIDVASLQEKENQLDSMDLEAN